MTTPDAAGLPAEVAALHRRLDALRHDLAPVPPPRTTPPAGPARRSERPTVALVAAPGRGRRALAAALVGAPVPDGARHLTHVGATSPGPTTPGTAALDVPLLEELDLALPARVASGGWDPADASVLLVLADAGAPLDRGELAALAGAARRVEAVRFVLVGADRHRGWRTVLDADRDLVAEHVPRLAGASWLPVGSTAGIAALQRDLHRVVARRRRMLAATNALRAAAEELRPLTAVASAARTPGDGPRRADVHLRWRTGLAAARIAAVDDLAVRVRALAGRTRDRVDGASRAELAVVPAEVATELEALAAAVVAGLADRLRELVAASLAGLPGADRPTPAVLAALGPRPVPAPATPPVRRGRAAEDRLLVVTGASGGLGLSRLALLPLLALPVAPVLGTVLVPVSVGLGLGAAAWAARTRGLALDRSRLRTWVTEALAAARTDVERVLAEALVATERDITPLLDAALDSDPGRRAPARDDTVRRARTAVADADALLAHLAALVEAR